MQRLHGRDANFLFQESPVNGMHTLKIQIIDPAVDHVTYDAIKTHFRRFLRRVPMLRQRVVFVPFGLHHPVLINDPYFDLDMHINRIALPAPGGYRELDEIIGQIASGNLDTSRPLWDVWVVEGLPNGQLAIVQKIHHTMADGMASVGYLTKAYTRDLPGSDTTDDWQPEPIPSPTRLVVDALLDHLRQDLLNVPGLIRVLWRRIRRLLAFSRERFAPTVVSALEDLPRTRFNYALSAKRNFASASLDLGAMQSLKQRMGGTLNDLVLSLVTTTLRNYLDSYGELPSRPLVASVPVAADEKGTTRDFGNNTANMMVLLPVHIPDPLERHRVIREITASAKAEIDIIGRDTWGRILHYVPPAVWRNLTDKHYRERSANRENYKVNTNLIVSNVPGPREKLGDMTNLYSVGPLIEGTGLNVTVWSYCNYLNFSMLACKRAMPDLHRLSEGLAEAVNELESLLSQDAEAAPCGSATQGHP